MQRAPDDVANDIEMMTGMPEATTAAKASLGFVVGTGDAV